MQLDMLDHWTGMLRKEVETNRGIYDANDRPMGVNPSVAHDVINEAMASLKRLQGLIPPPMPGSTPNSPWAHVKRTPSTDPDEADLDQEFGYTGFS